MKARRHAFQIIDRVLDRKCGARWQSIKWKLSYRGSRIPPFADLVAQPHRQAVCNAVLRLQPRSVLEVGCGRGANLFLLRDQDSSLRLSGTDIVETAIANARKNLAGSGSNSVELRTESLDALSKYPDGCFDVVLSDAVLMYVPPSKIQETVAQMRRVARLGVVISAWHGTQAYDEGTWIYDYSDFGPCKIERFPKDAVTDARWKRYGAVVTLRPVPDA